MKKRFVAETVGLAATMFLNAEKTSREFSVQPKRREAFDGETRKAEAATITITRPGSKTLEPIGIQKHGYPTRAEKIGCRGRTPVNAPCLAASH